MTDLTVGYINDHMQGVHTFDSWGRSVIEKVLNVALEQLAAGPQKSIEFDMHVVVKPFEPETEGVDKCLRVCINAPGAPPTCQHITVRV